MRRFLAPSVAYLLPLSCFFATAAPASAQILSKWGHPVITLGLTPYDSVNVGHGNYPGGPGFIPGYGYYPGPFPSRYPWLDGPDVPFDRRTVAKIGAAVGLEHKGDVRQGFEERAEPLLAVAQRLLPLSQRHRGRRHGRRHFVGGPQARGSGIDRLTPAQCGGIMPAPACRNRRLP